MMRRKDVLIEFSAPELAEEKGCNWDYPDTDAMADEIVRLREQLAVSESLREAQVKELSEHVLTLVEALAEDGNALAKAERILDALREPSRAVLAAANEADGGFLSYGDVTTKVIRAAVMAAEQEASDERA